MTPEEIYSALDIPDSCRLGKRVFKKLFVENGQLSAADRRVLSEGVGTIHWQYTLKPTTIPVAAFRDSEHEYEEIALLEMELTDRRAATRLTEIVHRTIPYPVLLVLADDEGVRISAAPKRFSRSEHVGVVVTSIESTPWLDGASRAPLQSSFISSLRTKDLPHTHFRALYDSWLDRIVALNCAELSGSFDLAPSPTYSERRAGLDACLALQREIDKLRNTLRSETSFARKVELNTRIKRLESQLQQDSAAL